ncbi:uncharacterized protein DUF4114 [Aestuariispira insulae]|uniref:Uncharacterized protein DUF4114 n=2 Tax=Aestuariispira insulae TaxID=1461337 RepID=A0A3D9H4C3_9PROT|nr:uncharacterized protein DUF4114 [Aestuariispira insulae]
MSWKYTGPVMLLSGIGLGSGQASATDPVPDSLQNVEVEGYMIDTVERALPEQRQVGAEFLDPQYDPNISFTADSQVAVTFISEGAGYRNTLGYFSYDAGAFDGLTFGDIDLNGSGSISARELEGISGINEVGIVFGNASGSGGFAGSGGTLNTGDTWVIGDGSFSLTDDSWTMEGGTVFEQDTQLGFFVAANAWTGDEIKGWDNNQEVNTYWSLDFLNPENAASATLDDVSDVSRHVAMLNVEGENQILMGFEDLLRPYGDNDFNDAVFLVRTNPEDGFDTSNLPTVSPAPSPGLGLIGTSFLVGAGFLATTRTRRRK